MWRALAVCLALAGCSSISLLDNAPPNRPEPPGYDIVICGWVDDQSAVECFEQALDESRGAELFASVETLEGDPIYFVVRATEAGQVEMYIDTSQDVHGGANFQMQVCDGDGFEVVDGWPAAGRCDPVSVGW